MDKMLSNKKYICIFILPTLAVIAVMTIYPIIDTIVNSLYRWDMVNPRKFLQFKNYADLFSRDDVFLRSLRNTLVLMAVSLVVQLPISVLFAALVSGLGRAKNFFKTVFFLPNVISTVAIGLLWSFVFQPEFGIVNSFLRAVGLGDYAKAWLGEEKYALVCIMIVVCWQFIGYHMMLFSAAISGIPNDMYEACTLETDSSLKKLRHVTLPLLMPVIKVDAVLICVGSLRFFDLIYVMTGGGPNHASEVLASHMYTRAFWTMQYGYGSAICVIMLALSLVVTLICNTLLRATEYEY